MCAACCNELVVDGLRICKPRFVRKYAPRVYQGAWKLREWLAKLREPSEPLHELKGNLAASILKSHGFDALSELLEPSAQA